MSEDKAVIKSQEEAIIENNNEDVSIDESARYENASQFSEMSIEALIFQMNQLLESKNILSVSKKAEEIRSIFYQKLKQISKEDIENKGEEPEEPQKKTSLHPLEIEFRKAYTKLKKEKAKSRKNREKKEAQNLEIKKEIIKALHKLTNQEESLKKTFNQFRVLQKKWRDTGHVPIAQNNSLWQS